MLLDISNNEEYIWTSNFVPNIALPSTSQSSSSSSSPSPSDPTTSPPIVNIPNKPLLIGSIIGSLIGGISLTVICFLLYKWNKNKRKPPNEEGILQIHGNTTNHELSIPVINQAYDYKQEAIPIVNDRSSSLQNLDNDVLQQFKNEMLQAVRQEIAQNVRQEIVQNVKRDALQNNG